MYPLQVQTEPSPFILTTKYLILTTYLGCGEMERKELSSPTHEVLTGVGSSLQKNCYLEIDIIKLYCDL